MESVSTAWRKNIIFTTWRSIRAYERAENHDKTGLPALGLALAGHPAFRRPVCLMVPKKAASGNSYGKVLGKRICVTLQSGVCLQQKIASSGGCPAPYPYEKVEEMIFILSVFPESDTLWQKLKGKIAACFWKGTQAVCLRRLRQLF